MPGDFGGSHGEGKVETFLRCNLQPLTRSDIMCETCEYFAENTFLLSFYQDRNPCRSNIVDPYSGVARVLIRRAGSPLNYFRSSACGRGAITVVTARRSWAFRVAVTLNLVTQFGGRRSAVIISVPCALALLGLAGPHVLKCQVDIRNRG
jgi:hypothetical protein